MNTPNGKQGWPKLLRDAAGLRVRLRREVQNGLLVIPAGTIGVIETSGNGWHLLQFRAAKCQCCGVSARVTRMSWQSFEVIQEDTP